MATNAGENRPLSLSAMIAILPYAILAVLALSGIGIWRAAMRLYR